MKVGVMQPYFFPYIGYWQLMNAVDEYIIYDDVNYIKRGWINRNNILFNGQSKRINLKIRDASQNRLIKDTQIAQTEEDIQNMLMVISQGYRKAPYYDAVYNLLERTICCGHTNLANYLAFQIREVCNYLGIKTKLILSSEIKKNNELKGEDKIIDICLHRNASCYINAIGGKQLYHQGNFEKKDIELKFLKSDKIYYKQFENEFVPNLSIIDLMMFNSVAEIGNLLQKYSLEA